MSPLPESALAVPSDTSEYPSIEIARFKSGTAGAGSAAPPKRSFTQSDDESATAAPGVAAAARPIPSPTARLPNRATPRAFAISRPFLATPWWVRYPSAGQLKFSKTSTGVTSPQALELQRSETPVQDLAWLVLRVAERVDQRPQSQYPAAVGRLGGFDVQLAVEGVALVHRRGVVAGLPAQHGRQVRQQLAGLRQRQPDGVAAVDQATSTEARIMMHPGNIQGEASQFRRTADYVGATVQRRSGQACIEVRPGDTLAKDLAIPIGGRRRRRSQIGTDLRQVVVMVGGVRVGAGAQRQHRAAVEVEDQSVGLVDGGDPQGHQAGGRPARLDGILLQPDNLGAGEQRVTDRWETEERQPAVEQVGLDMLGGQRRLADRDVADQARMR